VAESALKVRLDVLKGAQNPDGGWGYFPGKRSWLEPTVYAAMALAGDAAADRAWALLRGWQGSNGSWRPAGDVAVENFGTALCVTLALSQGRWDGAIEKGVNWLLGTEGAESNWRNRLSAKAGFIESERNLTFKGWPWNPGTSSWVEPTAQSLIALKKAAARGRKDAMERIWLGEAQLFDVKCRDGGWNYGSREALKIDLPSYPETTGVALVGLQGHRGLEASLDYAAREVVRTQSPLGRAWLTIALRLDGASVPAQAPVELPRDLQILALEALAAPEGNFGALRTEARG
jgi:hypothetical protein